MKSLIEGDLESRPVIYRTEVIETGNGMSRYPGLSLAGHEWRVTMKPEVER